MHQLDQLDQEIAAGKRDTSKVKSLNRHDGLVAPNDRRKGRDEHKKKTTRTGNALEEKEKNPPGSLRELREFKELQARAEQSLDALVVGGF